LEEPLEVTIWEEDETVPVGPADLLLTLPVGLGPTPDDVDEDGEDDDNDDDAITVLEAKDDETTEEVLETAEELVDGDPQFLS
jgi:hypothetical protein